MKTIIFIQRTGMRYYVLLPTFLLHILDIIIHYCDYMQTSDSSVFFVWHVNSMEPMQNLMNGLRLTIFNEMDIHKLQ